MKPDIPRPLVYSEMPTNEKSVRRDRTSANSNGELRALRSQQLFGLANEVLIEHAGATYRLRITQANKLILTK